MNLVSQLMGGARINHFSMVWYNQTETLFQYRINCVIGRYRGISKPRGFDITCVWMLNVLVNISSGKMWYTCNTSSILTYRMLDTQFETKSENAILESVSDRLYFNKIQKLLSRRVCRINKRDLLTHFPQEVNACFLTAPSHNLNMCCLQFALQFQWQFKNITWQNCITNFYLLGLLPNLRSLIHCPMGHPGDDELIKM